MTKVHNSIFNYNTKLMDEFLHLGSGECLHDTICAYTNIVLLNPYSPILKTKISNKISVKCLQV